MSNCVEIYNTTVIPLDQIDGEKLIADIKEIQKLDAAPEDLKGYIIWWFLNEKNTWIEDGLCIDIGNARSIHTWRDLKQLMHVLAEYVTIDGTIMVPLDMADEMDGFEERGVINMAIERFEE